MKFIAVDFDGTLSEYHHYIPGHFGDPIPEMVSRVQNWFKRGYIVVIFTARVWHDGSPVRVLEAEQNRQGIEKWCEKNIGRKLEVTCEKRPEFTEFYDDRAVTVGTNTGTILTAGHSEA